MRDEKTTLSEAEVKRGFEQLGLGANYLVTYPGAAPFAKQYKRCSILHEAPTTYSSSTVLK
ncbi:MAG: hypothetical protein ACD_55C00119G0003 [uncultured bacterium]|uniref:Uncharacterized protein n=1 Tax=Citrifermentans bemidjiense (strain ATCC BAA-1014 / DSM 16622 / JCM 12645 / Bem) TaxID=404380 RepID=B5EC09_CITBB|nr:hypothetical protein [Citrifermentans bemidjiense]ACH40465.1 hypothetical protein Gbem_3472 [Citrifermentans bemidjiense Bem]EKD59187.1 MAG: hypothetical protein ACD_55C00119G0003 [uncultured bacterium]